MSIFGKRTERGNGLFLSVMQGSFRQKADEFTEGAISRENKKKDIVWELHHETVNGHIENVYIRKNPQYGNELMIVVNNKEAKATVMISVPVSSSYTRKFFMIAGNIDYRAPVEIVPHYFADKKKTGKFVTGWCFYQHDSKNQIEDYINFDDVPKVIKKETVSGDKYDDEAAMDYLHKKFMKVSEKNGFKAPSEKTDDEDEDEGDRSSSRNEPSGKHTDDEDEEESPRKQPERKSQAPEF